MKASKLRIGNVVLIEGVISSIGSLQDNFYGVLINEKIEDDVYPIPINEEILLNLGFLTKKNTNWGNPFLPISDIHYIGLDLKGNIFVNGMSLEIKYIHQLQNLYFALTGTDLDTSKIIK